MTNEQRNHTPGPWRVNKYQSIGAGEFGTAPIVATVEPFYGTDTVHGDHLANARLIAAAPDLLALCKSMENWLRPEVVKEPDRTYFWKLVEVIRRAEGHAAPLFAQSTPQTALDKSHE